jgi:predicted metalloprotease with PDZ domain
VTYVNFRFSGIRTCVVFLTLFAFISVRPACATISYEISLAQPAQHLFHVTMTVPDVHGELLLQLPAWNALYQIRDFSSRVRRVEAFAGSHPLIVEKRDKLTWRVQGDGTITVRYAIYWDSPGPFASQLNEDHAFINPAMTLTYVPDRRKEEVSIKLSDVPSGWREANSLRSMRSEYRTNVAVADNYDALADAPIEVGMFKLFQINGIGPEISVVVHGEDWKQSDIENSLGKICRHEVELMGGAPYDHYLFIFHIGKAAQGSGGGMEHANGTAINVSSGSKLAGVSAHEFFHLWNVKRIRPASLEPVDYTREQYTRALWFAEGVTSTYGSYTLVRTGIWSKQDFYDDLARAISELESRPANRWQSAEQSSLDTWLDKYDYYNGPDFSVSYYTKGQVLGVLLDILIRDHTDDARSLDDVLRKMNEDFAKKGKTYRDSLDVRLTAESVAGASFQGFFASYVARSEPLPYESLLAKAGLLLRKRGDAIAQPGSTAFKGYVIVEDPQASSKARAIREGLLSGKAVAAVAASASSR